MLNLCGKFGVSDIGAVVVVVIISGVGSVVVVVVVVGDGAVVIIVVGIGAIVVVGITSDSVGGGGFVVLRLIGIAVCKESRIHE